MEFTKEEISLCKQIAEKYRREIGLGDWFLSPETGDVEFLCQYGYAGRNIFIPLWTISDCLEFLREKKYTITFHDLRAIYPELEQPISIVIYRLGQKITKTYYGKTPLEACLKAVLAVLEESK